MNEEDVQKKYAELQLINQNFQQLQEQTSLLKQQLEVLANVDEALNSIKQVKDKNSLLVPLGGGLFVDAEVNPKGEFLVNVGGDVLVKKNFGEAKEVIKKQTDEVSDIIGKLDRNMGELSLRSQRLQEEFVRSMEEMEGK